MRKLFLAAAAGLVCGGCGLSVKSPDLFLLTRTGQPRPLRMLVNDGGTIRCNGARQMPLPDSLLIQARTLASDLDKDATAGMHIARTSHSVAIYTVKLADGTISFPDTAAARHKELARAELFAVQAAQQACRLPG